MQAYPFNPNSLDLFDLMHEVSIMCQENLDACRGDENDLCYLEFARVENLVGLQLMLGWYAATGE